MNAEQKQRALTALGMWHSSNDSSLREYQAAELMSDMLQELVDKPEAEPVAKVTGYYGGYLSISTIDGRVLPAGTALYLAPPAPSVPDAHPDDIAVDRFAAAMKTKMAKSRAVGRYGWDDPAVCSAEDLRLFLVTHIAKGDPVDVGNFAMMLFNRGETTSQQELPADTAPNIEPSHEQLTQILNGLDRCAAAGSKREFLRVWIRDWTVHKLAAPQPPKSEPIAYIEHHKGGDNLVWDNPGGKYSVLYTAPLVTKLSDERILELFHANNFSGIPSAIRFARAIEREILGE